MHQFTHLGVFKYVFARESDHPFPVADQTTPNEVAFRWNGLSEWMAKGLTLWWFDHNWGFSIPPPNTPPVNEWDVSNTDGNWVRGRMRPIFGNVLIVLIVQTALFV